MSTEVTAHTYRFQSRKFIASGSVIRNSEEGYQCVIKFRNCVNWYVNTLRTRWRYFTLRHWAQKSWGSVVARKRGWNIEIRVADLPVCFIRFRAKSPFWKFLLFSRFFFVPCPVDKLSQMFKAPPSRNFSLKEE